MEKSIDGYYSGFGLQIQRRKIKKDTGLVINPYNNALHYSFIGYVQTENPEIPILLTSVSFNASANYSIVTDLIFQIDINLISVDITLGCYQNDHFMSSEFLAIGRRPASLSYNPKYVTSTGIKQKIEKP